MVQPESNAGRVPRAFTGFEFSEPQRPDDREDRGSASRQARNLGLMADPAPRLSRIQSRVPMWQERARARVDRMRGAEVFHSSARLNKVLCEFSRWLAAGATARRAQTAVSPPCASSLTIHGTASAIVNDRKRGLPSHQRQELRAAVLRKPSSNIAAWPANCPERRALGEAALLAQTRALQTKSDPRGFGRPIVFQGALTHGFENNLMRDRRIEQNAA